MDTTSTIAPPLGGWGAFAAQIAQRQPEAIAQLNKIYLELFNQTIQQGCGNCYQKAFYRIQKHLDLHPDHPLNHNLMQQPNRKYLLKPGCGLQTTFGGDTLTNDNLTDEAAEQLLTKHPSLIEHFEKFPAIQKIQQEVKKVAQIALPIIEIAAEVAREAAQS